MDRFTEVVLLDSSTIGLPDSLRMQWACYGSVSPAADNAGVKPPVAQDLKTGRLLGPVLDAARVNDKATTLAREVLPRAALRITDPGYKPHPV